MGKVGDRERELFYYKSGKLYWKNPTSNRVSAGDEAGGLTTNGYILVSYDRKKRMAHRIIWDMFNPEGCDGMLVDHIDGNPLNNSIENLRLADYSQNAANSKAHKDSLTGFKGVQPYGNGRFAVQIAPNGKRIRVGQFDTLDEAVAAYNEASKYYFGEYHREVYDWKA